MHNEENDKNLGEIFINHKDEGDIRDLDKDDDNVLSEYDARKIIDENMRLAQQAQAIIRDAQEKIQAQLEEINKLKKEIENLKNNPGETQEEIQKSYQEILGKEANIKNCETEISNIKDSRDHQLEALDRDGILESLGIAYIKYEFQQEESNSLEDEDIKPEVQQDSEEEGLEGSGEIENDDDGQRTPFTDHGGSPFNHSNY